MKAKIEQMLAMQDEMNTIVNPDWKNLGWDFCRAIAVEAAEMMDHYGWKWWKKQEPDIDQVKLELVDIWHFGMSHMIENASMNLASGLVFAFKVGSDTESFLTNTDNLMLEAADKEFDLFSFVCCMKNIGMTFDELHSMYIAKNVLNRFRQANGYKQGTYTKIWAGEEDNVHLMKLVNAGVTDVDILMDTLAQLYAELV